MNFRKKSPSLPAVQTAGARTASNDVNLGVLGEYKYGAGRGYRNIVGFFVGTGMGGGLILNNPKKSVCAHLK